ncbi:aminotransferase class I/II-fold pyridoxal phosphate-dependent enzyme [Nocardioides sp. MAH-18]|uniref:Aminotransferase class I/II-fold pyridoxal phosphate-dependent enzyme n=1 Tax=Nocardioides agri TaxID=2682843 RepID=A0A6L6XN76_9ACTN|nr:MULTISPECIES: PLP-dependent aminotransferase family protein [unclassified Nocardioides]MBA2953541.1 PLP-dependent aminotransferase family protein [Nocardioides sp. CGMCC 1.13656]MVQ48408.1 aminotransferase class I/II-fold pyridoxal phosphate-dependent enzyme [Nocardioides sp. MAH-18]
MTRTISAGRVATLVDGFDRSPAYAGLADALTLLIGDGRIGVGVRLPSERELTDALAVSRTTVTRAYAALREAGYAEARQGAGTFTRVPGGRSRAHDRALLPRPGDSDAIDLNCAAPSAPPGIARAYADAAGDLPAYLGGHGYFPAGLPELQAAIAASYDARGLPTSPEQVMVTPGALTGAAIVAQAFTAPGDRVLVESPTYPNATDALRHAGARLVPSVVDPDGWDLDAVGATLRQTAPKLAYLIPDFQNPTGHLMTDTQREQYAAHLRRTHTVPIVDEAHQALALEGQSMPRPFAAFAPDTITIGSSSKAFWGGLRLGWIRAPRAQMERLTQARVSLDLGAPVFEQLVLARLLGEAEPILAANRVRLREQRDALAGAVRDLLPEWTFHLPTGGLALWCRLPGTLGTAVVAEAEHRGVIIAPGPVFAAEGGLDSFVRIPWTRPADELTEAVRRVAAAWSVVRERPPAPGRASRVMVA